MRAFFLLVMCLGWSVAHPLAAGETASGKIEEATSPDGKYLLTGVDGEGAFRVEIHSKLTGKVIGRFAIPDFVVEDQRYRIVAKWKEDSTAFGVNISHGRNITECRFFVGGGVGWTEVSLPKAPIDKLRKNGNMSGDKAQNSLMVEEWQTENKVRISYQGNIGTVAGAIFRLVHKGKPHLELSEMLAPPEEEATPVVPEAACTFRIFAGGQEGYVDGPVAAAQFKWPSGVAVDAAGNIYVADRGTHTLRRITPAGMVETVAGSPGEFGTADGVGAKARFWYPQGLATDADGNIYVCDTSGKRVRKVTPKGEVTTLTAEVQDPGGVAVDGQGNVYVADSGNHVIRKFTRDGQGRILAGEPGKEETTDGSAREARFSFPRGAAVGADGVVFTSETKSIRKIVGDRVTTFAKTGAPFSGLTSLAMDKAGNLYATDHASKVIWRITPAGVTQMLRGPEHSYPPLNNPMALAFDAKGRLYVADQGNNTILLFEFPAARH